MKKFHKTTTCLKTTEALHREIHIITNSKLQNNKKVQKIIITINLLYQKQF